VRDTDAVVSGPGQIALSELIGALSCALDIAEGEPAGHAQRSCLIGMRIADELGLDADARSNLFYALLLKDAGCSANSAHLAALFGADDQQAKRTSKLVDWSRPLSAFVWSLRTVSPDGSLKARTERLQAIRNEGAVTRSLMRARCHRGAEIALKLGFPEATAEAIRALDEHWDGHGQPMGLIGTKIPLAARILCLAQTVEVFHAARGVRIAYQIARRRSGQWFDPTLVEALASFRDDAAFWASLREPDVAAVEPPDRVLVADGDRLDRIAEAFAEVIDAKSPWTHEHCDRVCAIATGIGRLLGFDEEELRDLRRAALLHDLGKLSISNRILDKPGQLTDEELAKVKAQPLVTEQILGLVPSLGALAAVASAQHERLDGRGYPRGLAADELTPPMRVLAVADVYEALTSERPHRAAHSPEHAVALMRLNVPFGLDPDAFAALERFIRVGRERTARGPLTGNPQRSLRGTTPLPPTRKFS
jgi:HD-GYP domain-containing protein (c-di-GMP phosphodiesterase class II)